MAEKTNVFKTVFKTILFTLLLVVVIASAVLFWALPNGYVSSAEVRQFLDRSIPVLATAVVLYGIAIFIKKKWNYRDDDVDDEIEANAYTESLVSDDDIDEDDSLAYIDNDEWDYIEEIEPNKRLARIYAESAEAQEDKFEPEEIFADGIIEYDRQDEAQDDGQDSVADEAPFEHPMPAYDRPDWLDNLDLLDPEEAFEEHKVYNDGFDFLDAGHYDLTDPDEYLPCVLPETDSAPVHGEKWWEDFVYPGSEGMSAQEVEAPEENQLTEPSLELLEAIQRDYVDRKPAYERPFETEDPVLLALQKHIPFKYYDGVADPAREAIDRVDAEPSFIPPFEYIGVPADYDIAQPSLMMKTPESDYVVFLEKSDDDRFGFINNVMDVFLNPENVLPPDSIAEGVDAAEEPEVVEHDFPQEKWWDDFDYAPSDADNADEPYDAELDENPVVSSDEADSALRFGLPANDAQNIARTESVSKAPDNEAQDAYGSGSAPNGLVDETASEAEPEFVFSMPIEAQEGYVGFVPVKDRWVEPFPEDMEDQSAMPDVRNAFPPYKSPELLTVSEDALKSAEEIPKSALSDNVIYVGPNGAKVIYLGPKDDDDIKDSLNSALLSFKPSDESLPESANDNPPDYAHADEDALDDLARVLEESDDWSKKESSSAPERELGFIPMKDRYVDQFPEFGEVDEDDSDFVPLDNDIFDREAERWHNLEPESEIPSAFEMPYAYHDEYDDEPVYADDTLVSGDEPCEGSSDGSDSFGIVPSDLNTVDLDSFDWSKPYDINDYYTTPNFKDSNRLVVPQECEGQQAVASENAISSALPRRKWWEDFCPEDASAADNYGLPDFVDMDNVDVHPEEPAEAFEDSETPIDIANEGIPEKWYDDFEYPLGSAMSEPAGDAAYVPFEVMSDGFGGAEPEAAGDDGRDAAEGVVPPELYEALSDGWCGGCGGEGEGLAFAPMRDRFAEDFPELEGGDADDGYDPLEYAGDAEQALASGSDWLVGFDAMDDYWDDEGEEPGADGGYVPFEPASGGFGSSDGAGPYASGLPDGGYEYARLDSAMPEEAGAVEDAIERFGAIDNAADNEVFPNDAFAEAWEVEQPKKLEGFGTGAVDSDEVGNADKCVWLTLMDDVWNELDGNGSDLPYDYFKPIEDIYVPFEFVDNSNKIEHDVSDDRTPSAHLKNWWDDFTEISKTLSAPDYGRESISRKLPEFRNIDDLTAFFGNDDSDEVSIVEHISSMLNMDDSELQWWEDFEYNPYFNSHLRKSPTEIPFIYLRDLIDSGYVVNDRSYVEPDAAVDFVLLGDDEYLSNRNAEQEEAISDDANEKYQQQISGETTEDRSEMQNASEGVVLDQEHGQKDAAEPAARRSYYEFRDQSEGPDDDYRIPLPLTAPDFRPISRVVVPDDGEDGGEAVLPDEAGAPAEKWWDDFEYEPYVRLDVDRLIPFIFFEDSEESEKEGAFRDENADISGFVPFVFLENLRKEGIPANIVDNYALPHSDANNATIDSSDEEDDIEQGDEAMTEDAASTGFVFDDVDEVIPADDYFESYADESEQIKDEWLSNEPYELSNPNSAYYGLMSDFDDASELAEKLAGFDAGEVDEQDDSSVGDDEKFKWWDDFEYEPGAASESVSNSSEQPEASEADAIQDEKNNEDEAIVVNTIYYVKPLDKDVEKWWKGVAQSLKREEGLNLSAINMDVEPKEAVYYDNTLEEILQQDIDFAVSTGSELTIARIKSSKMDALMETRFIDALTYSMGDDVKCFIFNGVNKKEAQNALKLMKAVDPEMEYKVSSLSKRVNLKSKSFLKEIM